VASIKTVIAAAAGVSPSAISLVVTPGSVVVTFEIEVASPAMAAASTSALQASIFASAPALETALTSQFETDGLPAKNLAVTQITQAPAVVVTQTSAPEGGDGDNLGLMVALIIMAASTLVLALMMAGIISKERAGEPIFQPLVTTHVANPQGISIESISATASGAKEPPC
jgi:hypothetical protein